jgi:hypothetical protein
MMSFEKTWEKITQSYPNEFKRKFEIILDRSTALTLSEKEFIRKFWRRLNKRKPSLSFLTKWSFDFGESVLESIQRIWDSMLSYIDIIEFRKQSLLLGKLFSLHFMGQQDATQGAILKKSKATIRKVSFNVLGSKNMKKSLVYNPMITPIQRETIMKPGIVDCAAGQSSTPLAPCRSSLSVAPLAQYPTDIIFKLLSTSREDPIIDVACFSDFFSRKNKFVEVGRVLRAELPYICVSFFFEKLLIDHVITRKNAPSLRLGAIPTKYYFDFTWLIASKNRYHVQGWRTIVQPPEKQDTSSSSSRPIFTGIGYESYLDKYEDDFIMRMFLEHDKDDIYTITQVDILITENPRAIEWKTYLSSL